MDKIWIKQLEHLTTVARYGFSYFAACFWQIGGTLLRSVKSKEGHGIFKRTLVTSFYMNQLDCIDSYLKPLKNILLMQCTDGTYESHTETI